MITLLTTLIFPYIYCLVILCYSYIDRIIATLAIPVNYGHANKVFVKSKSITSLSLFEVVHTDVFKNDKF